jgi:hypothetical protein
VGLLWQALVAVVAAKTTQAEDCRTKLMYLQSHNNQTSLVFSHRPDNYDQASTADDCKRRTLSMPIHIIFGFIDRTLILSALQSDRERYRSMEFSSLQRNVPKNRPTAQFIVFCFALLCDC